MKNTGKKIFGVLGIVTAVCCFSGCDAFLQALTSGMETSDSQSSGNSVSWEESVSWEDTSSTSSERESASSSSLPVESNSSSETSSLQSAVQSESSALHSDSSSQPNEQPPRETFAFLPKATETKYGYQMLAKEEDGVALCNYYQDMYDALAEFFVSEADVGKVNAGGSNHTQVCRIGEFDYGKHNLTQAQANAVLKTLRADYPEFYWLDNTFFQNDTKLYLQIDQEYAKAETRRAIEDGLLALVAQCGVYLEDLTTQTEKALTIYDFVTATITYAYKADGVTPEDAPWAHNLEGWTIGKAVCETYAEVYTWLCDIYEVPCITTVGVAGAMGEEMGGHAWNIVGIDGKWYTVDATWGDQDANSFLFREWFGKHPTEFAQTHIADTPTTWGKDWQVELPTLAEETLSPVVLRENGGVAQTYASPDYAFVEMRNEDSVYEMKLYPDTTVTADKGIRIYPKGAKFATATLPKVKKLTLVAKVVWEGEGADKKGYMPELTAINPIVLSSTLALSEVKLIVPAVTGQSFVKLNDSYAKLSIVNGENS